MNLSKLPMLLSAAIVLMSTSCQKELKLPEEEIPETRELGDQMITAPNGRKCLLKKVTENDGEFVYQFIYDEKNRVVKEERYMEGAYYQTALYEYKENFVLLTISDDITNSTFIYYKNNRVDSLISKSALTWDGSDGPHTSINLDTYTHKYDANGKLTEMNWVSEEKYDPPIPGMNLKPLITRQVFSYNNGDVISFDMFNLNYPEEFNSTTYDYYTDQKKVSPQFSDLGYGILFEPLNEHLLKTEFERHPDSKEEIASWTHTYAFDADGLITLETVLYKESGSGLTSTNTYAYEYEYK